MRKLFEKLQYLSNYFHVLRMLNLDRKVVFYIEESGDWSFFRLLYENFRDEFPDEILILTSEKVLRYNLEKNCFKIGTGFIRTLLFLNLKNCVVILTLTDLGNLQLKRSLYDVEYIYIFHSLASTKAVYLEGAFDNYDHIFCSTKIQYSELMERKMLTLNSQMKLYKVGYEKIDRIRASLSNSETSSDLILYAPTWNDKIFDMKLIMTVVKSIESYELIIQFHPMTQRKFRRELNELSNSLMDKHNVKISYDINNLVLISQAMCLITDWSGIAYEFAFGTKRPVISIDIPQKIRNNNIKTDSIETFERASRDLIGKKISVDKIRAIEIEISSLLKNKKIYENKIENLMLDTLHNSNNSPKHTYTIAKNIYLEYKKNL